MSGDLRWTPARKAGLLAIANSESGTARESNRTYGDRTDPTVYWQTATWLVEKHLAGSRHGYFGVELKLTELGIEWANRFARQLQFEDE